MDQCTTVCVVFSTINRNKFTTAGAAFQTIIMADALRCVKSPEVLTGSVYVQSAHLLTIVRDMFTTSSWLSSRLEYCGPCCPKCSLHSPHSRVVRTLWIVIYFIIKVWMFISVSTDGQLSTYASNLSFAYFSETHGELTSGHSSTRSSSMTFNPSFTCLITTLFFVLLNQIDMFTWVTQSVNMAHLDGVW